MIRKATTNDAEAIARIIIKAWESAYSNIIDPGYHKKMKEEKFRDIMLNNIGQDLETIFVYERDNSVKGFISGKRDSAGMIVKLSAYTFCRTISSRVLVKPY